MTSEDAFGTFLVITCVVMIFFIGFVIGINTEQHRFRKEAIINNAAHWMSSENGDAEFKWKTEKVGDSNK
jgi:hypothetical protein